ncbi:MAG: hypothetical protein ACKN89_02380 [Cyanobium sp.]|jgi:hypothetical protein|nr:hypothetical protein [Synechococcaceae cyanobacterium]
MLTPSLLSFSVALLSPTLVSFNSPWWEQYDAKEKYICSDRAVVVIERNDAQASLFSRGMRTTLFRDANASPVLEYRNDLFKLVLSGDELTLDQSKLNPFNPKLTCLRTEDA